MSGSALGYLPDMTEQPDPAVPPFNPGGEAVPGDLPPVEPENPVPEPGLPDEPAPFDPQTPANDPFPDLGGLTQI